MLLVGAILLAVFVLPEPWNYIAVIAVASSPMVRFFGDDPRHVNTWVLYFPYVWLPVVLVTVAIAGHVMVTRALRKPG